MKFIIEKLILWPKKAGLQYREVKFEPDKINIITGASRTGKSAIIPIIDYCLCSDKCAIPVDTIRNATSWFGILISKENEKILICRKEPGLQEKTDKMYIARGKEVEIPKDIEQNTNASEVKNILNELFCMSFFALDPTNDSNFSARPSYRDFSAFLFQPQNIVANADVMFYKADTMEHRQKLINIFPYALGAVTPQVLSARQKIEKLKKQKERIQKELSALQEVMNGWQHEMSSWLAQSKEIGFIEQYDDSMTFEEKYALIVNVVKMNENDSKILATNVRDLSDNLVVLRSEEQNLSSQLFALQKRLTEIKALKNSFEDYENSLQIQVQRLEISNWLKELVEKNGVCPFCNNIHNGVKAEIDELCVVLANIEKASAVNEVMPAAFEREMQLVEEEVQNLSERLNAIRERIITESGELAHNADRKYTLSSISRFLGRMESSLHTYEKIRQENQRELQISAITDEIAKLSIIVDENEIRRKQEAAIKYVNQKIAEIVKTLDVEHPDNPVEFVVKDLTLKISKATGRNDYLWEIGSASNWLAYHISTILAFQQFFQTRGGVSVPNFVIFDQPSQVYFPQRIGNKSDDEIKFLDEDKEAVHKIFTCMDEFMKQTEKSVQIIVTEHADSEIWGDISSVHLVARWRDGERLIPSEWL